MCTYKTIYSFLLFAFISMLLSENLVAAASPWDEVNVDSYKDWTIEFNTEIDEATINTKNIFVVELSPTSEGAKPAVTVSLKEDKKSVIVKAPLEGYKNGGSYVLVIERSVKSVKGKPLIEKVEVEFSIIEQPNKEVENIHAPYHGTIFIEPDIITENDPSDFVNMTYLGKGTRVMYDRRVGNWIEIEAFLFNAYYSNGDIIEIQVNPEFQSIEKAHLEAIRFANPIGQLPSFLRERVSTVWIHKGDNPFGGGNNNILIHTEQADKYIRDGILEETLFHEATHTSIDPIYSENKEWLKAQRNDGQFISSYAKEVPNREDLAESLLPYFALKYRSDRLSQEMINTISNTMPHRIDFFEKQNF